MENVLFDLALCQIKGIGIQTYVKLLSQFKSAKNVFDSPIHHLINLGGIKPEIAHSIKNFKQFDSIQQTLNAAKKHNTQIATLKSANFPALLKNIPDLPPYLFHKGEIPKSKTNIAIVGTRKASDYGLNVVDDICSKLPKNTCIISGLALGIDTKAHQAAIDNQLSTIAVLGSATDQIYPSVNKKLTHSIVQSGGCLLSEYPPGTKAETHYFPMRNRIVAGMSDIVIVVESKSKGGSLITAKLANDYNREVFAIPGSVFNKNSQGCNELIANCEAQIFTSVEKMLESINLYINTKTTQTSTPPPSLSPEEKQIFDLLSLHATATIDFISRNTLLPVNKIASLLLTLEFQGYIKALPGNKFELKEKYK